MSQTTARTALICALVGLGASGTAAYVHYHMLRDPTYTSFCDVSATMSCPQAYPSRFGTFQGVPVATFGAIWFALATLLSVAALTGRAAFRESVPGYLFAGSTLPPAGILFFGLPSVG